MLIFQRHSCSRSIKVSTIKPIPITFYVFFARFSVTVLVVAAVVVVDSDLDAMMFEESENLSMRFL